jgi:CheY-like chemotaxis protein
MIERAGGPDSYDVLICDGIMPGMGGLELAAAVRADHRIDSTRIILMRQPGCRQPLTDNLDGWLAKPIRPARLLERLVSVLGKTTGADGGGPGRSGADVTEGATLGKSARILIVEDNPLNRELATLQLKKLGYTAEAVDGARAGLEALAANAYDLILMDCEMPEMDGYQATVAIRQKEGADHHTVIIAMTAHAMGGAREKCLAAGMDDYIAKPVSLERLSSVLARWLSAA